MNFRDFRIWNFLALLLAGALLSVGIERAMGQAAAPPAASGTTANATPASVPSFEVATIKAGTNDDRQMLMFTPDGMTIKGVPMQMILREAFHTEDDHLFGAPAWVKSTRYDIEAKVAADDAPKLKGLTGDQRVGMLLPLIVDRFNMKYHHETRELTTYSLVVAKGGVKMKPSAVEDAIPKDAPKDGGPDAPKAPPKGHMLRMTGPGHIESEGTETKFLAHVLSQQLGKSVVDKTGLTGGYDYILQWTPDDAPPGMAGGGGPHDDGAPPVSGPSLFTAVEEQLGLKIESSKGMVDVIVIDHLDLPSAN